MLICLCICGVTNSWWLPCSSVCHYYDCVCVHSAWKGHPRNDLYCVGQDRKPYTLMHSLSSVCPSVRSSICVFLMLCNNFAFVLLSSCDGMHSVFHALNKINRYFVQMGNDFLYYVFFGFLAVIMNYYIIIIWCLSFILLTLCTL